jgi:3-dehydroquinate synthase
LSGRLPLGPWRRIMVLLERLGLPSWAPPLADVRAVLSGLQEFREHLGGRLTIMLLAGIGQPVEVHELEPGVVEEAIVLLGRRQPGGVRKPAAASLTAGSV